MLSFDEWSELTDGYDVPVIAALCKTHRTTVRRWRERGIPHIVMRFLRAELHGELPSIGGTWAGWRIGRDGLLYPPDMRRGFSPGEVRSLHWWTQLAAWRKALTSLSCAAPPPAPRTQARSARNRPSLPVE